jgi:hypothetical protein
LSIVRNCVFLYLEFRTMEEVQKRSDSGENLDQLSIHQLLRGCAPQSQSIGMVELIQFH